MIRFAFILPLWLSLDACTRDETIRAYGMGEGTWRLVELNGASFEATATLAFTDRNKIGGTGPCNSYTARMDVPFPWWGTGPIAATRMTCPDVAAETAYFTALSAAKLSEVRDARLILSAEDGTALLIFSARD
ncbi:META domain-containing protein [Sulfitobacter aestuariivivens]|uniref:META domain-containing protein n=1 Tax=Sulfitobacter aestuariivivens TaxID=2766981 RepID=A0A927HFM9_9RHOB|nr:META domain-containing protein [Sulfitobacter aestuariivivens]MBD3664599.1 META domain-containing protein [Sulfitobacter aestuariivivens]